MIGVLVQRAYHHTVQFTRGTMHLLSMTQYLQHGSVDAATQGLTPACIWPNMVTRLYSVLMNCNTASNSSNDPAPHPTTLLTNGRTQCRWWLPVAGTTSLT
jgi:hypothetical protein